MSALEESWGAGALIREPPSKDFPDGKPTWRYRVEPFQRAVQESWRLDSIKRLRRGIGCQGGYCESSVGVASVACRQDEPDNGEALSVDYCYVVVL